MPASLPTSSLNLAAQGPNTSQNANGMQTINKTFDAKRSNASAIQKSGIALLGPGAGLGTTESRISPRTGNNTVVGQPTMERNPMDLSDLLYKLS